MELTWILDPATGEMAVEGLTVEEVPAIAGDLLPPAQAVNCARPLNSLPLSAAAVSNGPFLQVARIYHKSLVDGPGRRSVIQLQGCPIRCRGCYVPETHDPHAGMSVAIEDAVALILDPTGEPRDGVTVCGGEPFAQVHDLVKLLERLKSLKIHTVVYSGYALEALANRSEPEVRSALTLIHVLIDGPFVAALAGGAGEWRGSRNQRVIHDPGQVLLPRVSQALEG